MRIAILLLLAAVYSNLSYGNEGVNEQKMNIAMRLIGHDFLLSIGDSNSRVLPITKIGERYQISFDREFTFEPDSLLSVLESSLIKSGAAKNYILEIQKCDSSEVVHASLVGGPYDKILPCGNRNQPVDCYQFYFTNLDLPEAEIRTESTVKAESPYDIGFLVLSGGLLVVFSFILFRKKSASEKTKETLDNAQKTHLGVEIGNYILEPNSMKLILKGTIEQLSGKECELLMLLNEYRNENVDRETILREVWGDQGDYVGRTLDVFISKLRKKLKADSNIEIKNIRGVGYRLIVS